MPKVILGKNEEGQMTFYIAKKDSEEVIVSMEHQSDDCWGGEITLADGSVYFIEPLSAAPKLPISLRAKRAGDGDGED